MTVRGSVEYATLLKLKQVASNLEWYVYFESLIIDPLSFEDLGHLIIAKNYII